MARKGSLVLVAVLVSALLSGCFNGETIKTVERSGEHEDEFTFIVSEGTDRIVVTFSTKGSPASSGTAEATVVGMGGVVYKGELAHGREDRAVLDDPPPGNYFGEIDYTSDYEGPAKLTVTREGTGFIGLGGSFWDIAGVILALLTLIGGAFVVRHHSSRLNREMNRIDETFQELRNDVDECRHELDDMQEDLRRQLVQRRIKESHYLILEKRIERHLRELERINPDGPREKDIPIELE